MSGEFDLADDRLTGRSVLILEDEFLIAMDIEQTCLEHGAATTLIVRSVDQLDEHLFERVEFDSAILDLRLQGQSTIGFAGRLAEKGIPFVFATGMVDLEEVNRSFPGVAIVAKPYAGDELMAALAAAISNTNSRESA
jgi:DNA-binding response OmpR family regulator